MVNVVLKFVSCARAAGLRISTSEVLDCLHQLQLVDMLDEPQFAAVLRANFAKSRREQQHFNRLYHLFFHELRQDEDIAHSEALTDRIPETLANLSLQPNGNPSYQAVFDFLQGDPRLFLEQLRRALAGQAGRGSGMGGNLGAVVRRLELMLQLVAFETALAGYFSAQRGRISWETRRDLAQLFNSRLATARRLLVQKRLPYDNGFEKKPSYRKHMDRLGEVHFASLTKKEVAEMRAVIEQLVRKLKDTVSRRYASRNRGILDVKKTLRRSAKYHGIPLELIFRNRPPRKAKIVALCDVSGSVWSAARFMLNMLYSLQECFTQVRSFVFVAGLDEVTQIFEDHEINQAIEKVLKEAKIEYNAATDYGLTFRQFQNRYLDIINKKTTFIIIGDGRTNYTSPEEHILAQIRERSRRVIWLNPETEHFWYTGDSEMRTYQACCHEVRPCQNLNQLLDFIAALVLQ